MRRAGAHPTHPPPVVEYFVRYYRASGRVAIKEVKGDNNPANFLTKAVGGAALARDRAFAMGQR